MIEENEVPQETDLESTENIETIAEIIESNSEAVNDETLLEIKEILIELKTSQLELNQYYLEAVPNFYWASNAIIVLICLIPLALIVKWFSIPFRNL